MATKNSKLTVDFNGAKDDIKRVSEWLSDMINEWDDESKVRCPEHEEISQSLRNLVIKMKVK